MEVSIQTPTGITVRENIVDCTHTGETWTLTTAEQETVTHRGTLLGATRAVEHYGPHGTGETLAVGIESETPLEIPTQPLAEGSSPEDENWEYHDGFAFNPPEIELSESSCTLRNVIVLAHTAADPADIDDAFTHLTAGDGGFTAEESVDSHGPYQAAFCSAWTSVPINGRVTRVTAYREDSSREMAFTPTADTRERVAWAFDKQPRGLR